MKKNQYQHTLIGMKNQYKGNLVSRLILKEKCYYFFKLVIIFSKSSLFSSNSPIGA